MQGPSPARDPVLRALAVAGVVVLAFFVLGPGGAHRHVLIGWLTLLAADAGLFVLARRVATLPGTPAPSGRLWWAVTFAAGVFGFGDGFQMIRTAADPSVVTVTPSLPQSIAVLIGGTAVVGAMLMYPTGLGSRSARVRFLLDAAATMTAVVVVAWCLFIRPSAEAGADALVAVVLSSAMITVGVFAAVKLRLVADSPLARGAALPMVAAGGVQVLGGTFPTGGDLSWRLVLLVLPALLFMAGPRVQALRVQREPTGTRLPERRRSSVLPYTGTFVSFAVLVAVLLREGLGPQAWGALAGLAVNVALVIVRQVLALAENARLLDRLDESLLEITRRERRLDSLVRHSSDITSVTGRDGRFSYVSPALHRTLGLDAGLTAGRRMAGLLHPDDHRTYGPQLAHLLATPGATLAYQARFGHADGSWRWLDVIATNLIGEPGIDGVVANARDVTETRELHERLRHQAGHDPLTGLANRRLFGERMQTAVDSRAAVLLIDLDGFKDINDTYGHHTGDEVLLFVAARLRAAAGPDDVVARLGGDEFAVLLPSGDELGARRVADRFLDLISAPAVIDGRDIAVRASVGLVAGDPADDLIHAADLRMYETKRLRAARREA